MNKLKSIISLLRVKQWVKNAFVFFPLIFSGHLLNIQLIENELVAFISFCLVSSGVYIVNDSLDRNRDLVHSKKLKRYLAYQYFHPTVILSLSGILLITGLLLSLSINQNVFLILLCYLGINVVYNLSVKNVVILDVIFIAIGFYLRIWAGSYAVNVLPSEWLQLCVFLLALFLGFSKRRHEMSYLKEKAGDHRQVLSHYTSELLDQIIIICATLAIVFYGMYTISADIVNRIGSHQMLYSVGFVIYGIFRYLYLVHVRKLGDDPGEVLLSDRPLLVCVVFWILFVWFLLYLPQLT